MDYKDIFQGVRFVKPVPTLTVRLDVSPLERWTRVIKECEENGISMEQLLQETLRYIDSFLPRTRLVDMRSTSSSWVGGVIRWFCLFWLGIWCRLFFAYSEDVEAFAGLIKRPVGELFLANVAYEVLGGCTTFIARDENDLPILCRTLDWPFASLAKYTVQFRWVSSSSDGVDIPLFYSVGWPGYVGVMTGMKPKRFAVALNARYALPCPITSRVIYPILKHIVHIEDDDDIEEITRQIGRVLSMIISAVRLTSWSSGSILREVLQSPDTDDYDKAVLYLFSQRLVAPSYFSIIGVGINDGTIITRETCPRYTLRKRYSETPSLQSELFVCQTNHDTGGADFSPDDFNSIDRYNLVRERLEHLLCQSKHISFKEAAKILMTSMNKKQGVRMKMTLYCTVMSATLDTIVSARSTRQIGL